MFTMKQVAMQIRVAAVALALGLSLLGMPLHNSLGDLGVQEASAATRLGGLNLNNFCTSKWGGTAVLYYYNAYGWRCRTFGTSVGVPPSASVSFQFYGIDMNEACRYQYGRGAWASTSNAANPYSWVCYR